MAKGNHCITVDDNKWDALAGVVNGSRSAWIERQIDIVLNIDDEESKLIQEIENLDNKMNVAKDKLCQIRKAKKERLEAANVFDECMVILNRLHDNLGCVGRNQIRSIAMKNKVPPDGLEEHCEELGLTIVNFMEVPK
ncbi:MAG: hypothetical protein Q4P11_00330 [Methanobrevibacter sp.]|nr:hypothetical protein [Methanobrevibacter sp.]